MHSIPCPKNFNTIDNNNMQSKYNNCSLIEIRNLDKAASYYLPLCSPWKLQANTKRRTICELTPNAGHTFNDFVEYMKELKAYSEETNTYNASFLQRCLHSYIIDTLRNMRTKIANKVMSAKFRARSTDKWGINKNGPPIYPTKQTVFQSINYWRHKHKIDARKISQSLPNDEDEINNMTSSIQEETRKIMQELQNECNRNSEKDDSRTIFSTLLHV